MAKYEHIDLFTKPFRVAFPNLVEPDDFSDKPNFNIRGLFSKNEDIAWFNNAVAECARKNGFINQSNQYTVKVPQIGDGDTCFTTDSNEANACFSQTSRQQAASTEGISRFLSDSISRLQLRRLLR